MKELWSENDLLIQISEGSEHAFELLFNQYHQKVLNYAYKMLQSLPAAEEVVQDVFIRIWVNRASLVNVENFGGYIRTVSRNHTLNALKKAARETLAFAIKNQGWTDADLDTENHLHYKDTRKILDQALNALPPQQKLIYSMCKVEGMKQDEVAQKLKISPLTVKSHLRQAAQAVRSFMLLHQDAISITIFLIVNQSVKK
ncbi:RNA polymerase sigma factor [Mucilaginibacter paludis]|uniref:RNA polymerase, sigma-24 subunit, ECF subfamily n=1 Tax=Mucilaginibacter paludis DSM 18603 TaxID=714943 RepID=H1YE34_9SPHI|nr:RNA polymerase sigma-70 factor [Mucilaginibacter paludis]EHQ25212.1 RNA polymerase, sigma-24 subunit, ECF subfamily [Mucilaginibacter paludis DSM 18603]